MSWKLIVDTTEATGYPAEAKHVHANGSITVPARSIIILRQIELPTAEADAEDHGTVDQKSVGEVSAPLNLTVMQPTQEPVAEPEPALDTEEQQEPKAEAEPEVKAEAETEAAPQQPESEEPKPAKSAKPAKSTKSAKPAKPAKPTEPAAEPAVDKQETPDPDPATTVDKPDDYSAKNNYGDES